MKKRLSLLHRTMGAVFVFSALLKMASFASFVQETRVYMDAYFWNASKTETTVLAVGVCAMELLLGVLAFKKVRKKRGAVGDGNAAVDSDDKE